MLSPISEIYDQIYQQKNQVIIQCISWLKQQLNLKVKWNLKLKNKRTFNVFKQIIDYQNKKWKLLIKSPVCQVNESLMNFIQMKYETISLVFQESTKLILGNTINLLILNYQLIIHIVPLKTIKRIVDFTNLIYTLAENNQVSQSTIQSCFNIFDENKDGKLDWNEYLKLFVEYIKKVQCLTYLKSLSSLEEQSQYLQQLQIAFLASPFKQLFTTQNLLSVEKTLASFENKSSNKHIKKYYFICRDSFEPSLNQLHQDIILFQDFNILPSQIIQVLKGVLLQRLPHVKINKIDYVNKLIAQIINNGYCDHLLKLLLVQIEDDKDPILIEEKDQNQILGIQALTLIAATIHIYNIQILIPIQSTLLVDTILNIISDTQNDLIIEQGYILLGHLILYDKSYQQILFTKRQALLDVQLIDDEKIFYHSWFIGCLFSRYENHQANKFITLMNTLPDNLLWLQSILNYYQQYGLIKSIETNQIRIQIQINMLIIIQPLLATQIHQDVLMSLLSQLQNKATDNRFKLQILSTLKMVFKLPYQLNYQNFTAQNILLSNNLLNILVQLTADPNSQLSYKAKKLFFKTLCLENSGILLKYLQESNNLQSFLFVLESQFVQNIDVNFQKYFKYKILTILRYMSQDSNTFQILSTDQWFFKLLIKALNDNNQIFTSNNQVMINCQYDYRSCTRDFYIKSQFVFNIKLRNILTKPHRIILFFKIC